MTLVDVRELRKHDETKFVGFRVQEPGMNGRRFNVYAIVDCECGKRRDALLDDNKIVRPWNTANVIEMFVDDCPNSPMQKKVIVER